MAFIALKPCSFAGKQFKIGEAIPDGLVLPEVAPRLIKLGKIAEMPKVSETETEQSKLEAKQSKLEPEPEPEPESTGED